MDRLSLKNAMLHASMNSLSASEIDEYIASERPELLEQPEVRSAEEILSKHYCGHPDKVCVYDTITIVKAMKEYANQFKLQKT